MRKNSLHNLRGECKKFLNLILKRKLKRFGKISYKRKDKYRPIVSNIRAYHESPVLYEKYTSQSHLLTQTKTDR